MPPNRHLKLFPRTLFSDHQSSATAISKSKSFSSKQKNKKHFQIPLQKCHSFKLEPSESFFQPIKPNVDHSELTENGHLKNPFATETSPSHQFGYYPAENYQKPLYNIQSSPKVEQTSPSNDIPLHLRKLIKFNSLDKRTTGPLICVKNDVIPREYFHEHNDFLKLQYPQPLYGGGGVQNKQFKPNGLVYADLALSDNLLKNDSKNHSATLPTQHLHSNKGEKLKQNDLNGKVSKQCKKPNRHKTEYATLKFNEIGQEIDV